MDHNVKVLVHTSSIISSSLSTESALYVPSNRSRTIFSDVVIHSSVQPAFGKYCSLWRGWRTGETVDWVHNVVEWQVHTHSNPINFRKIGFAIVTIEGLLPHCECSLNRQGILSIKCIGGKHLINAVHGRNDGCDVWNAVMREKKCHIFEDLDRMSERIKQGMKTYL